MYENTTRKGITNDVILTGHAFRKNTAGAFGPDLAKKLSQLVKMEKNLMRTMELMGKERMEVAVRDTHWASIRDSDVQIATTLDLG